MEKNKTGKYLKYAIGEIILVVLGILIALQINNWNQQRLDAIDRNKIIANLNEEFIQNKKHYTDFSNEYKQAEKTAIELMSYIGLENLEESDKHLLDSLLNSIFPSIDYLPSNNAIDDIIQSGKLKSLDNPELSNKLANWKSLVYTISAREKKLDDFVWRDLIPYLNRYISWRDGGVIYGSSWSTKGKLPTNHQHIVSDLEFENLLENHIYIINQCSNRHSEAIDLISDIILLTARPNAHD
jgi:hypothetical protein